MSNVTEGPKWEDLEEGDRATFRLSLTGGAEYVIESFKGWAGVEAPWGLGNSYSDVVLVSIEKQLPTEATSGVLVKHRIPGQKPWGVFVLSDNGLWYGGGPHAKVGVSSKTISAYPIEVLYDAGETSD